MASRQGTQRPREPREIPRASFLVQSDSKTPTAATIFTCPLISPVLHLPVSALLFFKHIYRISAACFIYVLYCLGPLLCSQTPKIFDYRGFPWVNGIRMQLLALLFFTGTRNLDAPSLRTFRSIPILPYMNALDYAVSFMWQSCNSERALALAFTALKRPSAPN